MPNQNIVGEQPPRRNVKDAISPNTSATDLNAKANNLTALAGNGSMNGISGGGFSTSFSATPALNGNAPIRRNPQQRTVRSSSLSSSINDDVPPTGSLRLRRGSTLRDMQDLFKDTTDQVMQPASAPGDGSHWNFIPLAFALLPAVAGVFFKNGSVFVTDIILLFLTAVFLHWLIKFPWDWYHDSQRMLVDPDPYSTIMEEETEEEEADDTKGGNDNEKTSKNKKAKADVKSSVRKSAERELRFNEHIALLCCFVGPVLGGWLLHTIRTQLSSPGESLLSTFNICVFVLGAELRPSAQIIHLIHKRCAYLHTVVHQPPANKVDQLARRMSEMEAEIQELLFDYGKLTQKDTLGDVKKGIQPDLDALNRAVRRYEKKEAAKSLETETKFSEFDRRLNDVLTLAAAAHSARNQKPLYMLMLEWMVFMFEAPFVYAWKLLSLPAKVVESIAGNVKRSQALLRKHERTYSNRQRQLSEGRYRTKGSKPRGNLGMSGIQ